MTPKPDKDEIIKTTIRVPRELWNAVQHRAIDEGTSAQDIINRALAGYLKRK